MRQKIFNTALFLNIFIIGSAMNLNAMMDGRAESATLLPRASLPLFPQEFLNPGPGQPESGNRYHKAGDIYKVHIGGYHTNKEAITAQQYKEIRDKQSTELLVYPMKIPADIVRNNVMDYEWFDIYIVTDSPDWDFGTASPENRIHYEVITYIKRDNRFDKQLPPRMRGYDVPESETVLRLEPITEEEYMLNRNLHLDAKRDIIQFFPMEPYKAYDLTNIRFMHIRID